MPKGVQVELDSYRLTDYSVQIPCYICSHGNMYAAELCRNCLAPMSLAHQAHAQKIRPLMTAALGASGVGKTVYLGMLLDLLSRQPERMNLVARGAFSITLQQNTVSALSRCQFPGKTPNEPDRWNWVHCQIRTAQHRRPLELIMPDMAGESLFAEVDHPLSYKVIRSVLEKCSGVMVLIDALKLQQGEVSEDFVSMKLLTFLSELVAEKNGHASLPVALILSKADRCEECFDDPAAFARRHAPGLWQHCQQQFRHHRFFASGVAGACAYRWFPSEGRKCVPLRIEPRGVVEPFEWLVNQIKT